MHKPAFDNMTPAPRPPPLTPAPTPYTPTLPVYPSPRYGSYSNKDDKAGSGSGSGGAGPTPA